MKFLNCERQQHKKILLSWNITLSLVKVEWYSKCNNTILKSLKDHDSLHCYGLTSFFFILTYLSINYQKNKHPESIIFGNLPRKKEIFQIYIPMFLRLAQSCLTQVDVLSNVPICLTVVAIIIVMNDFASQMTSS